MKNCLFWWGITNACTIRAVHCTKINMLKENAWKEIGSVLNILPETAQMDFENMKILYSEQHRTLSAT